MPTVIAYIADYVAFYFAAAGNYVVSYWAAYAVVYAAEVYAINRAVQSLQQKKPTGEGRGLEVAITDTGQPGYAIYGQVRVGGVNVIPPISGGSDGRYLEQILAFAVHEVDSYSDFYVDDGAFANTDLAAITGASTDGQLNTSRYKDKMWVRRYIGTSSQTVDFILNNRYPTVFTSNFRGRGFAYAAMSYDWSDGKVYRGPPQMTFVIRGKKCYDPRTDSSPGASPTNPAFISWTDNAALCWADYAMADFGGNVPSTDINWASVVDAANVCDAAVAIPGATTQARYTFNCRLTVPVQPDWRENAKLIVDAMLGRMVWRDGKWFVYAGSTRGADYSVEKIDWLSIDRIKTVAPRDGGRWNAAVCWYVDASRNWQRIECFRRSNTTYRSADGGEPITLELEQPGCDNEYEAQRKAEFILRQSRNQIALAGKLGPKFRKIANGDVLALNFDDFGWVSKLLRVRSMNLNPDGSVDVGLTEEQPADWDDLLGADYNTISTVSPPATNPTTPSVPTLSVSNHINGTLRFTMADPVVRPVDTRFQIIRSLVSTNAAAGTVIFDGTAQLIDLVCPMSVHYYYSRAYSNSYFSAYSPNTIGISALPVPLDTFQVNTNIATDMFMGNSSNVGSFGNFAVGIPVTLAGIDNARYSVTASIQYRRLAIGVAIAHGIGVGNIGTGNVYFMPNTDSQLYTMQFETTQIASSSVVTSAWFAIGVGSNGLSNNVFAWSDWRVRVEAVKR